MVELGRHRVANVDCAARPNLPSQYRRLVSAARTSIEHGLAGASSHGKRGELRALFLDGPSAIVVADELLRLAGAPHEDGKWGDAPRVEPAIRRGLAKPSEPIVSFGLHVDAERESRRLQSTTEQAQC